MDSRTTHPETPIERGWDDSRSETKYRLVLCSIVILAWMLRLLALEIAGGISAPLDRNDGLDQIDYESLAYRMATGAGYTLETGEATARRSPGTSLFLLPIYLLFGRSLIAARLWMTFLSAGTCVAAAWSVRPLAGRTTALLIAGLIAINPPLISYSVHLICETPFILMTTLATGWTLRALRAGQFRYVVLGGLAWGMAILLRPQSILYLPMFGVSLAVFESGNRWKVARVMGWTSLLAVAVIAPWVLRNALVMGKPCLATLVAGHTFWGAQNETTFSDPNLKGTWVSIVTAKGDMGPLPEDELLQESIAWREGWAAISRHRDDVPALILWKLYRLITPVEKTSNALIYWSMALSWTVILPCVAISMRQLFRLDRTFALLIATQWLATILTTVVFYGCARFRHVHEVQFLVCAGLALQPILALCSGVCGSGLQWITRALRNSPLWALMGEGLPSKPFSVVEKKSSPAHPRKRPEKVGHGIHRDKM